VRIRKISHSNPLLCRPCGKGMTFRAQIRGFSLIELLVVMAVMLIVAAFAVPSFTNTMDAYRVRSTLTSITGLTQRCRVQALKNNTSERMHFTNPGGKVVLYCKAVSDVTPLQATDPQIPWGNQFSIPGAPTGGPTLLTGTIMWGSANAVFTVDSDPYFNSRGLPCAAVGVGTACSTISGYVYYVKYKTQNSRWAAISISPAGRMQSWFWNGTGWGN
jgi:prepilin-type N-terminal cleavage/methylation domain-containing protein